MEKLIESRGQYDELRYKVGEELRTIQNVRDLLGGDCIKEEYNEYMFGSNEPINNPIAPTGGKVPGISKNLEDMTYEEYKDYRQGK